jgi:phage gp29-like protein
MTEKVELREIATISNGRDITRGFVDALPLLPPQDAILAGRQLSYATYEQLLRDDQVAATFAQRRLASTSREWEVRPGGDKRLDKQAAKFLEAQLQHIRWDSVTDKMLFGVYYGYAVGECLWKRDGSYVVLDAIKVRKQRRFGFAPNGELRLLTSSQPFGEPVPPAKFWHFACGADNDDEPYGLGLAHWLYWPVQFKRNGLKFWLIFLDKFGMPTAKGTYPNNATQPERERLLAALAAIQTDSGIIVPEGMQIELIEAARSGSVDYAQMLARMDASIAKVVLGQTLTTEVGSAGGNRALGDVHMDVRQDLVKADADLVCQSFNTTVARWLTEWNFPGAAIPQVWRNLEEPEDLNSRAEREKKIVEMGFKPTLKHIQDVYEGDWIEEAASPVPVPPNDRAAAEFAEGDHRDPADLLADNLESRSAAALDKLVEPLKRLVQAAGSLEEIRDGLDKLYPDMDETEVAIMFREALAAAHLAGRFDIDQYR